LDSKKLALKLAELALTKKAEDIKVLDLRKLTPVTDFFVICTAHSDPQVKAISDAVLMGSKEIGETVWHKEGMTQKSWVLLDFVDVVVHIFLRDTRTFYGLEKLWGDAEITEVSDEPVEKPKPAAKPKAEPKATPAKTKTAAKPKAVKKAKPEIKKTKPKVKAKK
jgi:ribosome-associated protein